MPATIFRPTSPTKTDPWRKFLSSVFFVQLESLVTAMILSLCARVVGQGGEGGPERNRNGEKERAEFRGWWAFKYDGAWLEVAIAKIELFLRVRGLLRLQESHERSGLNFPALSCLPVWEGRVFECGGAKTEVTRMNVFRFSLLLCFFFLTGSDMTWDQFFSLRVRFWGQEYQQVVFSRAEGVKGQ